MRSAADRRRYRAIYRKYKEFTMIPGSTYVGNLCLAAMAAQIQGSIVECGTWRGGMIAGIADVLGPGRRYYLFDSFEGLPPAKEIDGPAALAWQADTKGAGYFDNCTASEQEARAAMSLSRAKDYQIVKGWFRETLPRVSMPQPIALLRMDGDWYESTKCILDNLAPSVARGGLIIVDDYYLWDGCTQAVNEAAAMRKWRIQQYAGICFIVV
jgi:O-methyltransferase